MDINLPRNRYKEVKKMDRKELESYLINLCQAAYIKGYKAGLENKQSVTDESDEPSENTED